MNQWNGFLTAAILTSITWTNPGHADFLPPNTLHLEDSQGNGMKEETFKEVIKKAYNFYAPIVESHGATLKINGLWTNNTVNAHARQRGNIWEISMYGGLARHPFINADGFALVLCHELGHHLGGFPLRASWAANEGQSDYFATLSCARELWAKEARENKKHTTTVDDAAKKLCDKKWRSSDDRALCYRIADASFRISSLLARGARLAVDTPDFSKVSKTNNKHPKGQCRLDTMMAGATCDAYYDIYSIPKTEEDAKAMSCTRSQDYDFGPRPLCWFKPPESFLAM